MHFVRKILRTKRKGESLVAVSGVLSAFTVSVSFARYRASGLVYACQSACHSIGSKASRTRSLVHVRVPKLRQSACKFYEQIFVARREMTQSLSICME